MRSLNTNKEIVAIQVGALNIAKDNDILFVGSKTNLLAFGNSKDLMKTNFRC